MDEKHSTKKAGEQDDLIQSLLIQSQVNVEQITVNVSQSVIVTTEDKLKLCLKDHLHLVEMKKEWITPLSLFIALTTTLITADFKDMLLLPSSWKSIFIVCDSISIVWLILTIRKAYTCTSLESLISKIKDEKYIG